MEKETHNTTVIILGMLILFALIAVAAIVIAKQKQAVTPTFIPVSTNISGTQPATYNNAQNNAATAANIASALGGVFQGLTNTQKATDFTYSGFGGSSYGAMGGIGALTQVGGSTAGIPGF